MISRRTTTITADFSGRGRTSALASSTTTSGCSKASSNASNAGARAAGAEGATLGIENGWFVGNRKVVREQGVWIHRGVPGVEKVKQAYRAYEQSLPMNR